MTTGSSPAPSASTPPDSQAELLEIRARADRLLANWQRAEADLANLRRRVDTERADLQSSAVAAIAFAILPIADDLERALSQVAEPLKGFTWVDGIWLT
jgi:molecular chaperone GrpE (heat shock protein)